MSAVRRLDPRNDLTNVPHMLRAIAADIEDGREGPYRAVVVIAVVDGWCPPDVFEIGAEQDRLTVVGALAGAQAVMLRTAEA